MDQFTKTERKVRRAKAASLPGHNNSSSNSNKKKNKNKNSKNSIPKTTHTGEQLSLEMLRSGWVSSEMMLRLTDMLPSSARAFQTAAPLVFNSGVYVHGSFAGVMGHSTSFRYTTLLLTAIIRSVDPAHRSSSVSLIRNMTSAKHKDSNNLAGSLNMLVPLN